jgi:glutaredoxin-like protein
VDRTGGFHQWGKLTHLKGARTMSKSIANVVPSPHTITMYATRWCGDCRRAKRWFERRGIAYVYIDIDRDDQAAALVISINQGMRSVPTILFPDGSVLVEPTSRELEAASWFHRPLPRDAEEQKNTVLTTSSAVPFAPGAQEICHPRFAAWYNRSMERPFLRRLLDPLRRELVGQAHGLVLEVGAGGGQNFSLYDPDRITRVEAVEPDEAMLSEARRKLPVASVPIELTRASVEHLPFPDAHFEGVVVTFVFCSVDDPLYGLREIWRVLKLGGDLLLLEHVRAQGKMAAWMQKTLRPLTTRCLGNCHWDRPTLQMVAETGFHTVHVRHLGGGLQPLLLLRAIRPVANEENYDD